MNHYTYNMRGTYVPNYIYTYASRHMLYTNANIFIYIREMCALYIYMCVCAFYVCVVYYYLYIYIYIYILYYNVLYSIMHIFSIIYSMQAMHTIFTLFI